MRFINRLSKGVVVAASSLALVLVLTGPAMAGSCSSKGDKASTSNGHAGHSHADHVMKSKDIVDIAVSAGSFSTLVAAVQAAGLVDVLKSDGPFTVFAPTDEAFAKLPEGTVEALLNDKEKLTAILTYHVVPGKLLAEDVVQLKSSRTVQGENINIKTGDGVMVNNANVIKTDIGASNGVIHVIDTVILPEGVL